MRVFNAPKAFVTQSGDDPKPMLRSALYDVEQQIKQQPEQRGVKTTMPTGTAFGDTTVRIAPFASIGISVSDGRGNRREVFIPMNLVGNDAIADVTGGATIDAEARTAINEILSLLRSVNIITP